MVCVNVRSHIRAPACTRLHPLTPTCTRSHISHACGCADVRIFAHPHFHTHFQKFFCKTKLRQPHHARCTHFARVQVCGRAKFCTSALSHSFPRIFLQKKTLAATSCKLHTFWMRVGEQTCEISHIHTFAHISKVIFCKKNSSSHTMHVAHVLHMWGCEGVRNFEHPNFCTHFHMCRCVKFCTSALSNTFPEFANKLQQPHLYAHCILLHIQI